MFDRAANDGYVGIGIKPNCFRCYAKITAVRTTILAEKRTNSLLLTAFHVGDDLGIGGDELLADRFQLAGIDFADAEGLHRFSGGPLIDYHVVEDFFGPRDFDLAADHSFHEIAKRR